MVKSSLTLLTVYKFDKHTDK